MRRRSGWCWTAWTRGPWPGRYSGRVRAAGVAAGCPGPACAATGPAGPPGRRKNTREKGHGRAGIRTLKVAHISGLYCPHARQALKITRWRRDTATGKASRQAVYAVTSLTSADATAVGLARLAREQWSIEAHHHVRDLTFGEDAAASRTGSGPANLATIRATVSRPSKTPATCTSPKADVTTPPPPGPSASTAPVGLELTSHEMKNAAELAVRVSSGGFELDGSRRRDFLWIAGVQLGSTELQPVDEQP
ncbi:MAG: hypothetical protein JOY82_22700, partial [Streptosporangiaceae bacterium]|nr:hypothetical protein [Streptosporangiaceae bacterium]